MVASVTRGKGHGVGVAACTEIDASCERVWETVADIESWPSYHENILNVERIDVKCDFQGGEKYRISKLMSCGHVRVCNFTVTQVINEGPIKSMKFFHDEGGLLSMVTLTVEPNYGTYESYQHDTCNSEEMVAKGCRLIETAAVEFSCPFGKVLMAVSCFPPLSGMFKRHVKRKFERGLNGFAMAAEKVAQ